MNKDRMMETLYVIATGATAMAAILVFLLCAIALLGLIK